MSRTPGDGAVEATTCTPTGMISWELTKSLPPWKGWLRN